MGIAKKGINKSKSFMNTFEKKKKQQLEIVKPESVGLSKSKLKEIDKFIKNSYLDKGRFVGTSLLVSRF